MTNATKNRIFGARSGRVEQDLLSLEVEAELEKSDRQAGHDYLPMDVFVDPGAIKEHFQVSSICCRRTEIH